MTTLDSPSATSSLGPLRQRIDAALLGYSQFGSGCPGKLGDAVRYSLLAPGKRLRPVLVLLANDACGGEESAAMPAACAVEMIHAYSLIHDDLPAMDDDDLRRGRPTCHKVFGEAMAILAGDALLALAFEVLASAVQPRGTAAACCAVLAQAAGACHLVGGQADDIVGLTEGDLAQLESIHNRKTGALIAASIRLGALTADADADRIAALDRYSRCLGLAFQITDDLLDVQGEEQAVGKRCRKDAQHGKLTFPAFLGVEGSRRRAEELIDEACTALALFGSAADPLRAVAHHVLERNR